MERHPLLAPGRGIRFHGSVQPRPSGTSQIRLSAPEDPSVDSLGDRDEILALARAALQAPVGEVLRSVPGRATTRPRPGMIHKRFEGPSEPLDESPAAQEAERLGWLAQAGIPAPRPLALASAGAVSVLAMGEEPGVQLPAALLQAGARQRADLCRELGLLVARLHSAGLFHRDLYLEHVLVQGGDRRGLNSEAGRGLPRRLLLLDAGRVVRDRRSPRARVAKDLAAALHSFPRGAGGRALQIAWGSYRRARGLDERASGRLLAATRARRVRMARHRPIHGEVTERPQHVVLRLPNWVGDLVMATPVIAAAAQTKSIGRLSIMVKASLAPLLRSGPWGRAEVECIRDGRHEAELFRRLSPDAAVLLNHSLGSALRARRARIPAVMGLAVGGRGPLLTHALVPPTRGGRRLPIPTAHMIRDVAALAGIHAQDVRPVLGVDGDAQRRLVDLLSARAATGARLAVCAPGAAKGPAKLWPSERWAGALEALQSSHGLLPVVIGGPGEEAIVKAVVDRVSGPCLDLGGSELGLDGLAALVERAEVLLVGDSGPRWMAAALATPCVSVMGPNSPSLTATSFEQCTVVRLEGLPCAPCLERDCPLGHHRCMRDLPAESVIRAAQDLLEARD